MTDTTLTQYLNLITGEHRFQPNYIASVTASISLLVDLENLFPIIESGFDLDSAIGEQLDFVGQWVGQSRNIPTPLVGVYFSWDTAGLGWDQGVWQGPEDAPQGLTVLADADYRLLLRCRIAENNWDGTIVGAAAGLANLFNNSETPGTLLFIQDNYDMTMDFIIAGEAPTAVFQALLYEGYLGFVPAGVGVNYFIVSSLGPAFGFDMENDFVSGWDTGNWIITLSA